MASHFKKNPISLSIGIMACNEEVGVTLVASWRAHQSLRRRVTAGEPAATRQTTLTMSHLGPK